MIWDIPLTSGLAERTVSWRGGGSPESSEFVPKIFTLAAGAHTLIVRGREADCELGTLTIAPRNSGFFSSIIVSGTSVTLTWESQSGSRYRVACKSRLTEPAWSYLSGDLTATGPTTSWTDLISGDSSQRYYAVFVSN
jgi:hypothetical protein